MSKPLQDINDNGKLIRDFGHTDPSMFQLWRFLNHFTKFDGRTIYLQKWLNDYWDPFEERIQIINNNQLGVFYLFNDVEEKDPIYFYNAWDSTTAYTATPAQYAVVDDTVYVAIANSTNQQPPNLTFWSEFKTINYFFNTADPPSNLVK